MSDVVFGSGMEEMGVYTGIYDLKKAAYAVAERSRQVIVRDGSNPGNRRKRSRKALPGARQYDPAIPV